MKSRFAIASLSCLALAGCMSFQPANYQPRYSNYSVLKSAPRCTAAVTEHRVTRPGIETLSMRGSTLRSPVGSDFSGFIAEALNEEFAKASVYAERPQRAVTLLMDKNQLDIPTGTGTVDIGIVAAVNDAQTGSELARIPVQVHREWPSSFFGGTAVNLAIGEYSEAVAELNGKLLADPQFLNALNCSAPASAQQP